MIACIDAVFCMFKNCITNFVLYFRKIENCKPEDCLTA